MKRLVIIGMLCNNFCFANPSLSYEEAVIAFKQIYFANTKNKLRSEQLIAYTPHIIHGITAVKPEDTQEKKDTALQYLVDIYYQQSVLYPVIKIAMQKIIGYGANPNLDMVEKRRDAFIHLLDYKGTPMLIATCEHDEELRDFLLVHKAKRIVT